MLPATVLRVLGPNRYLIQIDPRSATTSSKINVAEVVEQNMIEQGFELGDALKAVEAFKEVDPQEPLEVDGTELQLHHWD
jgi:hypothetical protein